MLAPGGKQGSGVWQRFPGCPCLHCEQEGWNPDPGGGLAPVTGRLASPAGPCGDPGTPSQQERSVTTDKDRQSSQG